MYTQQQLRELTLEQLELAQVLALEHVQQRGKELDKAIDAVDLATSEASVIMAEILIRSLPNPKPITPATIQTKVCDVIFGRGVA